MVSDLREMASLPEMRPIVDIPMVSTACLFPGELINGDVINGHLRQIERRGHKDAQLPCILCLDTFFVTALRAGGTQRAARFHKRIELTRYEKIFIPVHEPEVEPTGHWWLVYVDVGKREISAFDSLGGVISHRETLVTIARHLVSQGMGKEEDWQLWGCRTCPKQTNGQDCGVYVCEFVDLLSRGISLNGHSLDPLEARRRIARTLREREATNPTTATKDIDTFSGEAQWDFEDLCEELEQLTNPESWLIPSPGTSVLEETMEVVEEEIQATTSAREPSPILSLSPGWSLASSIEVIPEPDEDEPGPSKEGSVGQVHERESTRKQETEIKKSRRRRTMKIPIPGTNRFKRVNVKKLGLKKFN